MKNARQQRIIELIEKYEIDTQQTLIDRLAEVGIKATQTTVSRDIRQLNLVKGVTERGTYKYVLPQIKRENSVPVPNSALTESVLYVEAAENIVVIRTISGMANALAVCVDSLKIADIVGSVAGDDTILLVLRNRDAAAQAEADLRKIFEL